MNIYEKIKRGDYTSKLPWPGPAEDKARRRELRKLHYEDQRKMYEQFYQDLCKHTGEPDCKRSQLIFEKAWADGHACGLSEVVMHFEDLSNFLDKVRDAV